MASHDTLINLFERIHFFLQRLKSYTVIPLTDGLTELLGKIMAQILCILALSTKVMTERRISELIDSPCPFWAHYDTETFLKRLVGKTDVEDALLRLDVLTKEECLIAVARNLEVSHHVDYNVNAAKNGMQHFPSVFIHIPTPFLPLRPKIETHEIKRLSL